MSRNLQSEITGKILAKLREGVCPWKRPWNGQASGSMPRNAITGALIAAATYRFSGSLRTNADISRRAG